MDEAATKSSTTDEEELSPVDGLPRAQVFAQKQFAAYRATPEAIYLATCPSGGAPRRSMGFLPRVNMTNDEAQSIARLL